MNSTPFIMMVFLQVKYLKVGLLGLILESHFNKT